MTSDAQLRAKPTATFEEIGESHAGQRIDNFLMNRLKGVPKSYVYRIIRRGEVRVNKGRVKPTTKLCSGDIVRVPPTRTSQRSDSNDAISQPVQWIENVIVYEDDGLLVVNKPSGLAVHGGSGVSKGLIEVLRASRQPGSYLELVHRIDRDTSGLIMVAKKRSLLLSVQKALQSGRVNKVYHALVLGKWSAKLRTVDRPLQKIELPSGERVVRVLSSGKASETRFNVLARYSHETLVEARPVTGRTHQIRVHTQHSGHPIIGDSKYCREEDNRAYRELGLKRLFLHAQALELDIPEYKSGLVLAAPYSDEWTMGLSALSAAK